MIKYKALSAIIFATCSVAPEVSFADSCTTGKVTAVGVGLGDRDSGNEFAVQIDNGKWWTVNVARNLNDAPGYAILHTLTTAQVTGNTVELHDDKGTRCDDFNAVIISNG